MATGIEMLGQMGTDQSLAGPVQGGNMVIKPNQVPVGGAAMLSKALRGQADKGVGGMYVLPEQEDQTPDFMKIAKSNVMRDINGQRNQYPMNYAENEGGIIPMLPRNLKTAPGAPETTLAYITPEEQAVLGLLNPGTPHIGPEQVPTYDQEDYGTFGPTTYTSGGGQVTGGGGNVDAEDEYDEPDPVHEAQTQADINAMIQGMQETGKYTATPEWSNVPGDGEEVDKPVSTTQEQLISNINNIKESLSEDEQNLVSQAEAKMAAGDQRGAQSIINAINNAELNSIFEGYSPGKDDSKDIKAKKKKRFQAVMGALTGNPLALIGLIGGGPSKEDVLNKLKDMETMGPREGSLPADFQNVAAGLLLANKDNPGVLTAKEEAMIKAGGGFTSEDKIKEMISSYKGGKTMSWKEGLGAIGKGGAIRPDGSISLEGLSKSLTRADKRMLKEIDPEMYAKLNFANTSGGHEALGQEQYIDTKKMDRDSDEYKSAKSFNRSVMESREIAGKDRAEQRAMGNIGQRPGTMGGGAGPVIEDEVTEAVVEEGATTMPYTGPRTGGAEVNVPLSRRFALDPTQDVAQYRTQPRSESDIYKYFTEGTTGEGLSLEPYSEFQKRRRKALGREPLDFWSY
jgi:hypothetical protein